MESEEDFSENPDSFRSQNSDSICPPSLHNSSICNNGYSSVNDLHNGHVGGMGNMDIRSSTDHIAGVSMGGGVNVRRSASGVLRCGKDDDDHEDEDDEDHYRENENLLANDDMLHSVMQNEAAFDNGSLYRDERDPFDG